MIVWSNTHTTREQALPSLHRANKLACSYLLTKVLQYMSAGSISRHVTSNIMKEQSKIEYKSSFTKQVRIKPSQLDWLKDNKPDGVRTVAGFLDIIINKYKKNETSKQHTKTTN